MSLTGGMQRAKGQERIDFLADVRNKAAEPMMQASTQMHLVKRAVWPIIPDYSASWLMCSLPEGAAELGNDICPTAVSMVD